MISSDMSTIYIYIYIYRYVNDRKLCANYKYIYQSSLRVHDNIVNGLLIIDNNANIHADDVSQ